MKKMTNIQLLLFLTLTVSSSDLCASENPLQGALDVLPLGKMPINYPHYTYEADNMKYQGNMTTEAAVRLSGYYQEITQFPQYWDSTNPLNNSLGMLKQAVGDVLEDWFIEKKFFNDPAKCPENLRHFLPFIQETRKKLSHLEQVSNHVENSPEQIRNYLINLNDLYVKIETAKGGTLPGLDTLATQLDEEVLLEQRRKDMVFKIESRIEILKRDIITETFLADQRKTQTVPQESLEKIIEGTSLSTRKDHLNVLLVSLEDCKATGRSGETSMSATSASRVPRAFQTLERIYGELYGVIQDGYVTAMKVYEGYQPPKHSIYKHLTEWNQNLGSQENFTNLGKLLVMYAHAKLPPELLADDQDNHCMNGLNGRLYEAVLLACFTKNEAIIEEFALKVKAARAEAAEVSAKKIQALQEELEYANRELAAVRSPK